MEPFPLNPYPDGNPGWPGDIDPDDIDDDEYEDD